MQKILVALLVSFGLGCATSYIEVTSPDGTIIKAAKNSFIRKGPYLMNVKAPTKDSDVPTEIIMAGNDEGMSGNLALLGALIGGATAGPQGAAAGGVIGGVTDLLGRLKGVFTQDSPGVTPTPTVPKENMSTKPEEINKPKRVLIYRSRRLIYSSKRDGRSI